MEVIKRSLVIHKVTTADDPVVELVLFAQELDAAPGYADEGGDLPGCHQVFVCDVHIIYLSESVCWSGQQRG